MFLADLFRPKWKHSKPSVRLDAIKALTDQALLAKIAKTDSDPEVRDAAEKRLTDLRRANPVKIIMDQAKKMVQNMDTSRYLRPGVFASIKEIEASCLIALAGDFLMSDQEITDLVVRNYGVDEARTRQIIKNYRYSRKR